MDSDRLSSPDIMEVPIFPLPDVVFFPRTILPLHIFEQRYRQMVSECVSRDKHIGMVLQKPDWDHSLSDSPPVYSVGGLGTISDFQELEDGKYDIVLSGIARFEILDFVADTPYQIARVKLLGEAYDEHEDDTMMSRALLDKFRLFLGGEDSFTSYLEEESDFHTLVNSLCSAIPIPPGDKQSLLEMTNVRVRAEATLSLIGELLNQKEFVAEYEHLRPDDPSSN
jgi:Lon protease-like protein